MFAKSIMNCNAKSIMVCNAKSNIQPLFSKMSRPTFLGGGGSNSFPIFQYYTEELSNEGFDSERIREIEEEIKQIWEYTNDPDEETIMELDEKLEFMIENCAVSYKQKDLLHEMRVVL